MLGRPGSQAARATNHASGQETNRAKRSNRSLQLPAKSKCTRHLSYPYRSGDDWTLGQLSWTSSLRTPSPLPSGAMLGSLRAVFVAPRLIPISSSRRFHASAIMSNLSVQLTAPNGRSYTQPIGLFINNEFVASKSGEKIASINPSYVESRVSDRSDANLGSGTKPRSRPCTPPERRM